MKKHLILATAVAVTVSGSAFGGIAGRPFSSVSQAWKVTSTAASDLYTNASARYSTLTENQKRAIVYGLPAVVVVGAGVYVYNTYFATDVTPEVTESAKSIEVTPVVEETEVVTEVVEAAPVKAAKAVRKPVAKRRVVRPAVRRGGCANGRCGRR
jgi:hypothetical protein